MNLREIFETLAEGTQKQAVEPNVHAYKPHVKQTVFHTTQRRHRLYIGGNRSGKTTGGIVEDIWIATGKHPYRNYPDPPVRGRVVSVDFINGIQKVIIPQFKRWCPASELRGGSWESAYDKQERILHFDNDSFIEFMSYDQKLDKFSGTSRHWTHFDEEPPQDIFIECLFRLMDTKGDWFMTLTPILGMDWMYDDIYLEGKNNPESNITVIEVSTRDNPHLDGEEISTIEKAAGEDADTRIGGKFIRRGGLVYGKFDPEIHVIDPLTPDELESLRTWRWFASLDHGYNNPTAWLWHGVSPDNEVITFWEHYQAGLTVHEHSRIVLDNNLMFKRVPDVYVGDPAIAQRQAVTGASIQTEYSSRGIPIALGNNDVLSGINRINQYLSLRDNGKPSWYITRNCENLIWELQRLKWKTWSTREMERQNNKYDVIHKKDDHACDSARYFFTMMPDLTPFAEPVDTDQSSLAQALLGVGVQRSHRPEERVDHKLWTPGGNSHARNSEGWDIRYSEDSVGIF